MDICYRDVKKATNGHEADLIFEILLYTYLQFISKNVNRQQLKLSDMVMWSILTVQNKNQAHNINSPKLKLTYMQ